MILLSIKDVIDSNNSIQKETLSRVRGDFTLDRNYITSIRKEFVFSQGSHGDGP